MSDMHEAWNMVGLIITLGPILGFALAQALIEWHYRVEYRRSIIARAGLRNLEKHMALGLRPTSARDNWKSV